MDVVMNDVRLLVKKELAAANKKFPMFASAHEGWAVIREELQEVKDDHYMLEQYLAGRKRSCSADMAEKYGVSEQVIRKYKRQFEEFIRKFFEGISF